MRLEGLRAIADCGAWYAALRSSALMDYLERELGDHSCTRVRTRVVFSAVGDASRTLSAQATPIASVRAGATSFRWAWAAGTDDTPTNLGGAGLRRTGELLGLPELRAPEIALEGSGDVDLIAATIAAVAVQATGLGPAWCVETDGGREIVLLAGLPVPEPGFRDFVDALPHLIDSVPVADHRVAISGLAARSGWHLAWQAGAGTTSSCIVSHDDHRVTLAFDGDGHPVGPPAAMSTKGRSLPTTPPTAACCHR
ncbi:MAG: hypothetical protein QM662_13490 [Gordonia sp. (in: high G+C Gram-positive bacteria)]